MDNDSVRPYFTEDTPAVLSHAGSNTDLSVLSIPIDNKSRKDYLSDSSSLSGDNENILAECIQSGMPKPKKSNDKHSSSNSIPSLLNKQPQTSTPIRPFAKPEYNLENLLSKQEHTKGNEFPSKYLSAKDETSSYAVENSPCQYSMRSSLSDLTIDTGGADSKK